MSAGVAKVKKTGIALQEETIAVFEEVFSTSFEIWSRTKDADWAPHSSFENSSTAAEVAVSLVRSLLEQCDTSGKPQAIEVVSGRQLLAIPLGRRRGSQKHCAISVIGSDSPSLLVQLAMAKVRELQYEADLAKLREENEYFLKQVSEDFEELAFLRLMAERLALGDCANNTDELISFMLPVLGRAVSLERLYYFEGDLGSSLRVAQEWISDTSVASPLEPSRLEELVECFGDKARSGPVVKNYLHETGLCPDLPELQEFVLVAVSTSMGPIGWLLGVNKIQTDEIARHEHLWRLSYNEFGTSEASLISTAGAMLASYAHNLAFLEERESLLVSVVRTLVSAIESKDNYTCGHSERVARYGKCLAKEVGYDQEACERLYLTGLLHDLGKIGVSDAVLKKEGSLTNEEFAEIQQHPDFGWAILRELDQLEYVLPGVLHHHERVDGRGYPDQLSGDEIPRDGQLLAVVDAFDAMTSDRPYRKGMPVEKAIAIFKAGAGTQWDVALVEAFLKVLPEILVIKDGYRRPPVPIRKRGELSVLSSRENQECYQSTSGKGVIAGSEATSFEPVWQSL